MRRDSTVEKRFIELGPEFGNNMVVERGLVAGEQVVTEGFHKLTPGLNVRAQGAAPMVIASENSVKDNNLSK